MRKMRLWMIAVALAVMGMCIQGFSQTSELPPPPPPGNFLFGYIEARGGWNVKTVTGAPYSAEAITETVRILSDGNRRDRTLSMIGPWSSSGKPPEIIFIHDPVAGVNYVLNPATKTAYKRELPSETS